MPKSLSATHQISIDHLKPGMCLVGIDQSWMNSPFFFHKRLIKDEEEIAALKRCGVHHVVIDSSRGQCPPDSIGVEGTDDRHDIEVIENELDRPLYSEEDSADQRLRDSEISNTISQHQSVSHSSDSCNHGQNHDTFDQHSLAANESMQNTQERHETLDPSVHYEQAQMVLHDAVNAVEQLFDGITTGAPIDRTSTYHIVNRVLTQVLENATGMLQQVQLQALQQFEPTLYHHVVDTCVLSLVLGVTVNLEKSDLEELGIGALLHDIGYLRLPRNVLRKRSKHTKLEQRLLEQHPERGKALVSSCQGFSDTVCRIVGEHHERPDGSGYPTGLKSTKGLFLTQIVSLVDDYEGLTNNWKGFPRLPPIIAIRKLYQYGQQQLYDMFLVEQMVHMMGVYPIGSFVELTTGERALVIAESQQDRTRPIVKLLTRANNEATTVIDLSQPADAKLCTIRRMLDPVKERLRLADYL